MKRYFEEDEGFEVRGRDSKKFSLSSLKNVIGALSTSDIVSRLEPFVRRVVKDEVGRAIGSFHDRPMQRPSLNPETDIGPQLQFVGILPQTIFTGSKIVTEDTTSLRIEIVDGRTKRVIATGPLSSVKIEVLVLDGDFGCDENEDWSEKDFKTNIVREREGKRPLLSGERSLTLRGGIGYLGEISFTDNSSWIRSRKFRLGARVVHRGSNELRIKEARSATFIVKDHRGELYKKHYPPQLSDDVWRLEKISKDGAFHRRLTSSGIGTVKEFLRLNETDPSSLKDILGTGISNRTWEAIVEHAATCVIDDKKFFRYQAPQHKVGTGLLFNSIYKVVGAMFDGQSYLALDKLTFPQTLLMENMKKHALRNLNELIPIDAHLTLIPPRPLINFQTEPLGSTSYLPPLDFTITHQLGEMEDIGSQSHFSPYTLQISGPVRDQPLECSTSRTPRHQGLPWTTKVNHDDTTYVMSDSQGPTVSHDHDDGVQQDNFFQAETPNWFP